MNELSYMEVENAVHKFYRLTQSEDELRWRDTGVKCYRCGGDLRYNYLENRLYAIRCDTCEGVTLLTDRNSFQAAVRCGLPSPSVSGGRAKNPNYCPLTEGEIEAFVERWQE